jgi:hypothetical protein
MAARSKARVAAGLVTALLLALLPSRAPAADLAGAKRCRKAFAVQGRGYAQKRLSYLLVCADKLLRCELLAEIDGVPPTACRASVTASCGVRLTPGPKSALQKLALRFDTRVGTACQTESFDYADVLSTGPGGLRFGNGACAGQVDLPTFLPCLRDGIDARVDALVSASKPRTGVLLDNAGLGAGFPHLARPPMADVTVAATAPGSGTLVDPGTITVPAGSALRFAGDAATLGCSPSATGGVVVVTVGSGPTAQRHELREPYGAGDVAIFGPWTAGGSLAYSIALGDGECNDTVTGTVTIP